MPPIPDTQYVQAFFCYALARQPGCTSSTNTLTTSEGTYWYNIIRTAHPHGVDSLIMAFRELGKTLFESSEYLARNTNNHDYVQDLYQTYLLREPDPGGWAFWESLVPTMGRENIRRAFDESAEFYGDVPLVTLTGSVSGPVSSLISARVNPVNQSGNQMLARDAEWGAMLVSLPGRAGLDLGLGISYSSAATWTTSGPYIYFDEDNSSLSPGFRFGFPTVQEKFFDAAAAENVYLLITSAGRRVALRQIGSTNVYAAGDSSYLELTANSASSLLLRSSDGSQFTYTKIENEYRCTNIKDANGNYITANYNALGDLTTVVDTLNRTITFAYDLRLKSQCHFPDLERPDALLGFLWFYAGYDSAKLLQPDTQRREVGPIHSRAAIRVSDRLFIFQVHVRHRHVTQGAGRDTGAVGF
ncbi:MAG: DUF4214 domain-containing protein [Pyrinomonadaceae bacterium]|nr:DUF4214 domain-containing protein [Pyrinomonadaceae bacterium]